MKKWRYELRRQGEEENVKEERRERGDNGKNAREILRGWAENGHEGRG